MKSIGFKNFRKFVDFPAMNFNDITLMVGRNNSGKSTLVKAILLVINYLKNHQNQVFPFTTNNVNDVNIVSFDRARCKNQTDDTIQFSCKIEDYDIKINISGDTHSINGNVDCLEIFDRSKHLRYKFDFASHSIEIVKESHKVEEIAKQIDESLRSVAEETKLKTERASKLIAEGKDFGKVLEEIDFFNKQKEQSEKQSSIISSEIKSHVYSIAYDININTTSSGLNLAEYIAMFLNANEDEKRGLLHIKSKGEELTDDQNERLEEIILVQEASSEIKESIDKFISTVHNQSYYYWSAETQKQSALFSIRDNNNALAKAIHDFCGLNIQRGEKEYTFIKQQLKEFEIGVDFELISHVGEAYECNIVDEFGVRISLADKGMGSIQLMTLFFRLASIIRKHKNQLIFDGEPITYNGENMFLSNHSKVTLIIEEPELNLHPILQDKLMVLFHYVMNEFGVKFIIETHSEYLIRRSPLVVVDNGYTTKIEGVDNMPISVYFFKSTGKAENMRLGGDGKFEEDFEPGFINVADDAAVELFEKTV